jgi:alkanesulfonate monooxygenase SsuD/methylene tetrahydromethanopterin reductase-like flavin-dependent oxidoreductase (luciferase family)
MDGRVKPGHEAGAVRGHDAGAGMTRTPASASPGSLSARLSLYSRNRLKLGLFGANCSSGRAVTVVPERWSGNWPDCLRLARMADDAGIEFMLPVGRWKGYGGDTDYQGETLETVTWAAGLLAATQRITVFGTVHAPLIHPLVAAKQFVTADQIGQGRFGLNVVCGWNEDEFEMFGATMREHAARYEYAQEWLDAIKLAWSGAEDFDFPGAFIQLKQVRAKPKPFGGGRPIVMNAAASPTGQSFAIRNCDALFSMTPKGKLEEFAAHVARVQALARAGGRDLDVYTVAVVTCRPTTVDAEAYYRHCVIDHADWAAVDRIMAMRGVTREKYPDDFLERRAHQANGMGGVPVVGDPDTVARELAAIAAAGARGIALSFVNYLDELPYFCAEVLPRLTRLEWREPA